ncbi:hypothetical protein DV735_g1593, partial [Chaetothyriales sp. CBS 134920]
MSYPQLYVAFYRPRYGNYRHWSLYLQDGNKHTLYEVTGSHPNFRKNEVKANPQNSSSYLSKLFVASLSKSDVSLVNKAVEQVQVDNSTTEWDCQEYVIDIIEQLKDDLVLDEDDEDYKRARKDLRKMRGANV